MQPEVVAALLGAGIGGILAGGSAVVTHLLDARSESARFEVTRRDQARATMVEERRKLLDSGAVLVFEFDVIAHRIGPSAVGASAEASTTTENWDEFVVRLERFRTRLKLWFNTGPEDHDVVQAFGEVLRHVESLRGEVTGSLHNARMLLEALRQAGDPSPEETQQLQALEARSAAMWAEATARVDSARARYYTVAHAYLAGDPD